MKINLKLLAITFSIVVFAILSSTYVYYSYTSNILQNQQTKQLLKSANNFAFELQKLRGEIEESYRQITINDLEIGRLNLDTIALDFFFKMENDSLIDFNQFVTDKNVKISRRSRYLTDFVNDNPSALIEYRKYEATTIYFGRIISEQLLNKLSKQIGSEIAFVLNSKPFVISNQLKNEPYYKSLSGAARNSKLLTNFEYLIEEFESEDFLVAQYSPHSIFVHDYDYEFLIFHISKETAEFRDGMKSIILTLVLAGVSLSMILILLFTTRLRKQIDLLGEAAERIKKGDFTSRVEIVSQDEIGKLGEVFNGMIRELHKKENQQRDYTDFISLINRNPSLGEVAEVALKKIIDSVKFSVGALYYVEETDYRILSAYGIDRSSLMDDIDYYKNVITSKEAAHFTFDQNFPEIRTALSSIKIRYLLITPIIYNNKVVGILELANDSVPEQDVKFYIENIQEQLAIGLINAKTFEQLENYVEELKILNDEYLKQNEFVTRQHQELVELHKQLKTNTAELEVQKTKAEESSTVKSQFLASISHELKTPLNSIIGLTELVIKDPATNSRSKERLDVTLRNGTRLLNLINNILEFSKIESAKIELIKDKFLLNDFLKDIESFVNSLLVNKNVKFKLNFDKENEVTLFTDKSKLDQILINLLGNAVKFTAEGEIRLTVITDKKSVRFEISDTGSGIPAEHKEIIFEEFRQGDGSTSRRYDGTGLGLAICKRYVQLLGGKLTFDSIVNRGSVFTVELFDCMDKIVPIKPAILELPAVDTNDSGEEKKRVLVVNHSSMIRNLLGNYLSSNGYNVNYAESSSEGFKSALLDPPEVMILDSADKEESGWVIISKLKMNPNTEDIKIILTSMDFDAGEGYGFGIHDFLMKPFDGKSVNNLITKLELFTGNKTNDLLLLSRDKVFSGTMKNHFADTNCEISLVEIGQYAFELIKRTQPDTVFIDFSSPEIDALEIVT